MWPANTCSKIATFQPGPKQEPGHVIIQYVIKKRQILTQKIKEKIEEIGIPYIQIILFIFTCKNTDSII